MARVIKRKSPPILLIVFAFLFVIATAMAILGFTDKDRLKADVEDQKKNVADLKTENEILSKKNGHLVEKITGTSGDTTNAIKVATNLLTGERKHMGLVAGIQSLQEAVKTGEASVAQQKNLTKAAEARTKALGVAMDTLKKSHAGELAALQGKNEVLQADLAEAKTAQETAEALSRNKLKKVRTDLEKQLTASKAIVDVRDTTIAKHEKHIDAQNRKISTLMEKARPDLGTPSNTPDGKILQVASKDKICYVNLGTKDGMKPSVTFTVYAPGAANQKDYKGKIRILRASDSTSQCKIIDLVDETEPIRVGDRIANIAYHANRAYAFLVAGNFDLAGEGVPSQAGKIEVQQAIQSFGGKLAKELDVDTDFVVMGTEPVRPAKPGVDATDKSQKAYQNALREYNTYDSLKKKALAMGIPVLNTNRFLIFTGYMPEKKPM